MCTEFCWGAKNVLLPALPAWLAHPQADEHLFLGPLKNHTGVLSVTEGVWAGDRESWCRYFNMIVILRQSCPRLSAVVQNLAQSLVIVTVTLFLHWLHCQ